MGSETIYRHLLGDWPAFAAETSEAPSFLKERHLQVMWLEQRYFSALTTWTGAKIEVVSPGIWNAEAGPDFLKAHLRIDGEERHGDVEIHLVDSNWYLHRHDGDPRYDRVILHVSLWKPATDVPLTKSNGEEIVKAYLEPCLTIPLKRIIQLIDLDLYPYRKFLGSGRCAQALFRTMRQDKVEEIFSSAAYWRLEQKCEFLEAKVSDPELRPAAGMAMALGYKSNAMAFLELFLWLQRHASAPVEELLALAMGAGGFMEAAYQQRWARSAEYQKLLALWQLRESGVTHRCAIAVGQARPFNHPVRRLAALCHLVADSSDAGKLSSYRESWETRWRGCVKSRDFAALRSDLSEMIPAYQDAHWNSHYLFEEEARPEFLTLIGQDLRQQVLVNTLLPLLYGDVRKRHDSQEAQAFDALYRTCRAPHSGKRGYLHHRFFGDTPKGQLLGYSAFEQGAFQIHRDFCVHFEASCEGCPFIDRVRSRLE